jgi:hypothetical protein
MSRGAKSADDAGVETRAAGMTFARADYELRHSTTDARNRAGLWNSELTRTGAALALE